MPKGMGGYAVKKSTKIRAANGPLTPSPDVGHGVKNRGKYSSNRIADRVKKVGSGGKGGPF